MPPRLFGKVGITGPREFRPPLTVGGARLISLQMRQDTRPSGRKRVLPRTNNDLFQQVKPEYYFENGLRKVHPYYFEYQTYAKERWLGRTILDIFLKEFRDRPAKYYEAAIQKSLITLNGEPCQLDTIVGHSDLIGHRLHRHEPPVTGTPIKILHDAKGMLVIDKPASIPAHPSGRYRFNTVVEVLRHDTGHSHLSIINRLDRLTSGICVLATDADTAETLHQQMENRCLGKEYIARVLGQFPETTECKEPLRVVEHKLGLVMVDPVNGKASHTLFELVATNGEESIVKCRPLTGRTHQIRVHLRFLGYPITNDHLYNNDVWRDRPDPTSHPDDLEVKAIARQLLDETMKREGTAFDEVLLKGDTVCPECEMDRPDPTPDQMCIYLHAFKYSSADWSFETDLPKWAQLA